ncbi:DMT family transporter [Frigidibacter sp. RF13]|uniref:DMT family transporter n=1 Tax=Frigidibacter sp. RF13 TaxID=2997340 RepID=UPI00226ED11B|nr:DMT family transporter [Frigidibacter sp. RF13]MCY1128043.1 DMT family transporter [Frigidibacter sp. RF13]
MTGATATGLSPALRGHLAMLAFSALIAGSFSLGGQMANLVSPVAFSAVRFLLAALFVGAAALATGAFRAGDGRAPWRYLLLGLCLAAYFVLMFEGLKTAPPVSTAAVFTLTPLIAAGFGWLLLRQITTPRIAAALLIGGLGAVWVIFRADWGALMRFEIGKGEVIYFWGCVAHALYTPMVRKLNRGESPTVFSFGVLVTGFVVLTLWGWGDIRATDWTNLPAIVWITLFYTAFFASAVTFVLLQYAALRLPASKVMAYTYLTPSWVILWEIGFGNPAPAPLILIGVGATILALVALIQD